MNTEILKNLEKIKDSEALADLMKEYDITWEYIKLIPVCFAPLKVSARTQNGIVYINQELKDTDFSMYLVHEFTHWAQQCLRAGPTTGSTEDDYLDNKFEQQGFLSQTKYISETKGDGAAENYIEQVLDHHQVPEQEREKRREQLIELASKIK